MTLQARVNAYQAFGAPPLAELIARGPDPEDGPKELVRLLNSAFNVGCSVAHAAELLAIIAHHAEEHPHIERPPQEVLHDFRIRRCHMLEPLPANEAAYSVFYPREGFGLYLNFMRDDADNKWKLHGWHDYH